jgi:hypothetical protein
MLVKCTRDAGEVALPNEVISTKKPHLCYLERCAFVTGKKYISGQKTVLDALIQWDAPCGQLLQ